MGGNKLDEKSFWWSRIIGKLLFTIIVTDPKKLDWKKKLVIYIIIFVEIYNWQSKELVHKTYGIIKLKKYPISKIENFLNLGNQQFYKVFEVL